MSLDMFGNYVPYDEAALPPPDSWGDQSIPWLNGAQSDSQAMGASGNAFVNGANKYFQFSDLNRAKQLASQYGGKVVRANPTYFDDSMAAGNNLNSLGNSYYWSPMSGSAIGDAQIAKKTDEFNGDQGWFANALGTLAQVGTMAGLAWAGGEALGGMGAFGDAAGDAGGFGLEGGMEGSQAAGGGLSPADFGTDFWPNEGLMGGAPSDLYAASDFGYGFDPNTGMWGGDFLPNEGLMGTPPTGGAASDFGMGVNPNAAGLSSSALQRIASSLMSAFGGAPAASSGGASRGGGAPGMSGFSSSSPQQFGLTQAMQPQGPQGPQASAFIPTTQFVVPGANAGPDGEQQNSQNILRLAQALRQSNN